MKSLSLNRATPRRSAAPAPALTNISTIGTKWPTPKMTDSATAPAAAASAKSHVGAGGAREIEPIAFMAASRAQRPDSTSDIVCNVEATRSIATPAGGAGDWEWKEEDFRK